MAISPSHSRLYYPGGGYVGMYGSVDRTNWSPKMKIAARSMILLWNTFIKFGVDVDQLRCPPKLYMYKYYEAN